MGDRLAHHCDKRRSIRSPARARNGRGVYAYQTIRCESIAETRQAVCRLSPALVQPAGSVDELIFLSTTGVMGGRAGCRRVRQVRPSGASGKCEVCDCMTVRATPLEQEAVPTRSLSLWK